MGSAIGFLRAPVAYEALRSHHALTSDFDHEAANRMLAELADEATGVVAAALATTHQGHSQLSAQCSVCRLHRDPLLFSGTFTGCGVVNRPKDYNSPRPITTYAMGPAAHLIWLSRLKPVRLAPSGSGRVRSCCRLLKTVCRTQE